ncbi:MAG: HNH endonuclease [Caryophanon sp.]|nr:HNH endonuclease [Caryophanon sp.]
MFEKIDAKNPLYIETYEKYKTIYEDFKNFAQMLTDQTGRATKPSGKATSYARYLMRLTIFAQRQNPNFILAPTFETLKQIEQLRDLPQFKDYNKQEKSFPSGAIRCFRAFVTEKAMAVEDLIDTELNVAYLTSKELPTIKEEQLIKEPTKRHEKERSNYGQSYRRSQNESFAAKERSNYTCEMSDTHFTFLTEHHKKPYVEAHHLIPMAAQDYFDYTIDFAHNIAVLCPTCHRKIHYAQAHEKKGMIQYLFETRKANYAQYGIDITDELLLSFYKILD